MVALIKVAGDYKLDHHAQHKCENYREQHGERK